jgi:hypothetical protein
MKEKTMSSRTRILLIVLFSMTFAPAWSWDGAVQGRIAAIELSRGGNYDFRVFLEGSPAMCGNANQWAYINESDANYKAHVAVLVAAQQSAKSVLIYTFRDSSGYCKIGQMVAYST